MFALAVEHRVDPPLGTGGVGALYLEQGEEIDLHAVLRQGQGRPESTQATAHDDHPALRSHRLTAGWINPQMPCRPIAASSRPTPMKRIKARRWAAGEVVIPQVMQNPQRPLAR